MVAGGFVGVELLEVLGEWRDGGRCVEQIQVAVVFEEVGPAIPFEGGYGDGWRVSPRSMRMVVGVEVMGKEEWDREVANKLAWQDHKDS